MKLDRRLSPNVNVDLTPLIDIIYQLVIFFMITSVFKVAPGIALNLPDSTTSKDVQVSELRIVAVSESEIYLNKARMTLAELDPALRKAVEGKKPGDTQAVLEGDKATPYQLMVSVLDACRRNGIGNVSLVTQPVKKAPQ